MPIATVARPDLPSASRASRRAGARGATIAGAAFVAVAAVTFLALPQQVFTAAAVVGAEGGPAAQRPAMIQAALNAAVSRPVMSRAAASLAGTTQAGLVAAVRAEAGHVPGTLMVRAGDTDADKAAAIATSAATALVAELDEREQAARRDEDKVAARRLAALREAAATAHGRLAALGGDTADLASARTATTTRVDALRVRLDAIRAILAAGDPPLGAGRDVPPAIEALQSSYLDLTRRLAAARETLGDRHTTVVGLREGLERTSSELSAAWSRLAKATETELAEARTRAMQSARGGDADRAGAVAAARLEAKVADEALARAEPTADGDDVTRFRLIAAAPAPALAEGLAAPTRLGIAICAGLATLVAMLGVRRRRRADEAIVEPDLPVVAALHEPRFFEDDILPQAEEDRETQYAVEPMAEDEAATIGEADEETIPMDDMNAGVPSRARDELTIALAGALPAIAAIDARADIPVVMVATNEAGTGTMDVVLALGEAAAAIGQRVLIVEGDRARPALAAAVDLEAEPAVVDVLGSPRIVLRAEAGGGLVFLAPSFRDGARLAADLVRSGDALVADALADEFDLVVIDGDRAAGALDAAKDADAVLRVGRFASARDDEHFLAALGIEHEAFLGTVVAETAVFVPRPAEQSKPVSAPPATSTLPPASLRVSQSIGRRPSQADARRRVALR